MANRQAEDAIFNANWDALLKMFHKLVESNPADIKEKMVALKEMAKSKPLSPRQSEGISARCNNVINADYGNTKKSSQIQTAEAFSQNGKQH